MKSEDANAEPDLSLINAFLTGLSRNGISHALKAVGLKLMLLLVPFSEIIGLMLFLLLCRAVLNGHSAKMHSVLIDGRVSADREPPRDIMKKHFFQNKQGLWIHHDLWWNEEKFGPPRGMAVILHGHSEHVKRFHHLADKLNEQGIVVFGMDHQGFGRSEGDRGHVEAFEHYAQDVVDFMVKVMWDDHPEWQHLPRFVAGHSMGGLISIHVGLLCQQSEHKAHKLSGLMLSAPALHLDPGSQNWLLMLGAGILDFLAPKAPIVSFPSRASTSFLQVKLHATFDPLNYHGNIRVHQGLELVRGTKYANEHAPAFYLPILIVHGDNDLTVRISGSREFMRSIASTDKTLIELEGLLHEPWQEERDIRDPVLDLVVGWLVDRVEKSSKEAFDKALENLGTKNVPFKHIDRFETSDGTDFVHVDGKQ